MFICHFKYLIAKDGKKLEVGVAPDFSFMDHGALFKDFKISDEKN